MAFSRRIASTQRVTGTGPLSSSSYTTSMCHSALASSSYQYEVMPKGKRERRALAGVRMTVGASAPAAYLRTTGGDPEPSTGRTSGDRRLLPPDPNRLALDDR